MLVKTKKNSMVNKSSNYNLKSNTNQLFSNKNFRNNQNYVIESKIIKYKEIFWDYYIEQDNYIKSKNKGIYINISFLSILLWYYLLNYLFVKNDIIKVNYSFILFLIWVIMFIFWVWYLTNLFIVFLESSNKVNIKRVFKYLIVKHRWNENKDKLTTHYIDIKNKRIIEDN